MHRSMMQVYIKNSDQAVEFYQNVFGAEVLIYGKHENGTIVHAEQNIFGQIFAFCETPETEAITGNTMQFCLDFGEGKEELVREIIEKLGDGGKLTYHDVDWSSIMADITDKYGVRWCIFV